MSAGEHSNSSKPHRTYWLPTKVLLALTTQPWTHQRHRSAPYAAYLEAMQLSGWSLRTAHARNYLLWRNGRRRRSGETILVLPEFSERAPLRIERLVVLADLLESERFTSPTASRDMLARQSALAMSEFGMTLDGLADTAEMALVSAVRNGWLL